MALKEDRAGFTLIELMIVVAISSILLGVTLPLMNQWVERGKLTDAQGAMSLAIGKAIGAALRNRHSLARATPVANVCLSTSNVVTVLESDAANVASCQDGTGTLIWTIELDEAVGVTSATQAVVCICFDNTGLVTTRECTDCLDSNTFELAVGSRSARGLVY